MSDLLEHIQIETNDNPDIAMAWRSQAPPAEQS